MTTEPSKHRILLVEDEQSLIDVIRLNLELEGYHVSTAENGQDALTMARKQRYDLCILDVMLPRVDGFAVCKTLRAENNRIPILFLSAKSTGADRIEGLRIGGDDYLTKPFNLEELLLRISNLIRLHDAGAKAVSRLPERYTFGLNQVDFNTYQVESYDGKAFEIAKRETQLLRFLIENEGRVVSRDEILEVVWGYDVYPTSRTIDNYILAFRKYFESQPREPVYFHSVRGVGYKFVNPDKV
jgi:two-component system alkaline phosphatase synthesis response regulator PhoP